MEPVYATKRPKIYASEGRLVPRGVKTRPVARPAYAPSERPARNRAHVAPPARPSRPAARPAPMGPAASGQVAFAHAPRTPGPVASGLGVPVTRGPVVHGRPKRRSVPVDGAPDLPWFPTASFVRRTHGTAQRAQVRGLWRTFVFTICLGGAVTASHLAYYL